MTKRVWNTIKSKNIDRMYKAFKSNIYQENEFTEDEIEEFTEDEYGIFEEYCYYDLLRDPKTGDLPQWKIDRDQNMLKAVNYELEFKNYYRTQHLEEDEKQRREAQVNDRTRAKT